MSVRLTWALTKAITREICNMVTGSPSLPCVMQASRASRDLKTRLNWGISLSLISPREKSELWRRGLRQWCSCHPKRPNQITQAPAAHSILSKKRLDLAFWKQSHKMKSSLCQQATYEETSVSRDMPNHTVCFATSLNYPIYQFPQKMRNEHDSGSGCEVSLKRPVTAVTA